MRQETNAGNLDKALRDADDAYRRYEGRNLEWAWRFRIQKAQILIRRGAFADALKLLNQPVPQAMDHSDVAVRDKLARALALQYLQKFDVADQELQAAASLAPTLSPDLLGDIELQRGTLEVERKDYDRAGPALHSALIAARRQNLPLNEISALANLGYLAMWEEHYDQAIDWFKLTIEKARKAGDQTALAINMGNLGWNYAVMGDFENAEVSYRQAIQLSASAGLQANRVYWMNALGDLFFQEQRYSEAAATSTQALAVARHMDSQRTITECLNTLSEVALATGSLDLAAEYNRQAAAIENAGLDHFGIPETQLVAARLDAAKGDLSAAEQAFLNLLRNPTADTPLRWQAEARLAQLYSGEKLYSKAETEFRKTIRSIEGARASLLHQDFRISFLSSAIEFYQAYIDFLVSRGRPHDALSIADFSRAHSLEESFSPTGSFSAASMHALHPQAIAARFHSTLLFYWLGTPHSYLWLISPQKTVLFPLPPSPQIDALVNSYREALMESPLDPLSTPDSPGAALYSLLVAPAAKFIPQNSRVVVLSDGSLDTLNFETLIAPAPHPHYWIEDVTVSDANSLALLARAKSASAPHNASLLLVGNPAPADSEFPPLPQAPTEIQDVEQYFASTHRDVITGPAATPAAYFESNPGHFQFLHFVTHGTASLLQPLESAVILSPAGDSYKLYAREIIAHPLHAYLVTISACNGAGNRAYAGEGLVGLSWAFLRAGAHQVISALWEVSDASTPQLMNLLYEGLHRGEDPATALRNAKLSLLHSSGIYRKPFYWAPFQLYSGS